MGVTEECVRTMEVDVMQRSVGEDEEKLDHVMNSIDMVWMSLCSGIIPHL